MGDARPLDGELLAEWRPEGVREAWTDERGTRTGWWSDRSWSWSWRSAYGAGEPRTEVEASAYTWHAGDPTGLVYMRARYYDPEIGRFLSEDPLPAGNLYAYADGDPVGSWDPTGMAAVEYGELSKKEGPTVKPKQEVACEIAGVLSSVAGVLGADAVGLDAADAACSAADLGGMVPRRPRNGHLAGKPHPVTGIPSDDAGFPDFTSVSKADVKINYTGSRAGDFSSANKAAGFPRTPEGFTWHHHQDGTTMRRVPRDIHAATGHTGGFTRP